MLVVAPLARAIYSMRRHLALFSFYSISDSFTIYNPEKLIRTSENGPAVLTFLNHVGDI
jgi:hypothetical protein